MRNLLELNKQENGYSLAGVLIIFIVAAVLGMSIVALSVNSMNISNKEHDDQSAFYIAESGTTYRVAQVETLVESATAETKQYIEDVEDGTIADGTFDPEDEEDIKDKFFELFDEKLNPGGVIYRENYNSFELIKDEQPEAEITVEVDPLIAPTGNAKTYNVISQGTIGVESRLVHLPIEITWHEKPEYAVLTREGIRIVGKEINGDIGTINPGAKVVVFPSGGPTLNGEIYVPNGDPGAVEVGTGVTGIPLPPKSLDDDTEVPDLSAFPPNPFGAEKTPLDQYVPGESVKVIENGILNVSNYQTSEYTLVMNDDIYLKEITVLGNTILFIDVGSNDRTIVVDKIKQRGYIQVIGDGNLTIHVNESMELNQGTIAHVGTSKVAKNQNIMKSNSKVDKLLFYYRGPAFMDTKKVGINCKVDSSRAGRDELKLASNMHIFASLYAKNANINFAAGGGFFGNLFTGGQCINMKGGSTTNSQLILAPEADVIHSNGVINGIVVSKTYDATGGAELNYKDIDHGSGPISLEGVLNDPVNAGNTFMQRKDPDFDRESLREK